MQKVFFSQQEWYFQGFFLNEFSEKNVSRSKIKGLLLILLKCFLIFFVQPSMQSWHNKMVSHSKTPESFASFYNAEGKINLGEWFKTMKSLNNVRRQKCSNQQLANEKFEWDQDVFHILEKVIATFYNPKDYTSGQERLNRELFILKKISQIIEEREAMRKNPHIVEVVRVNSLFEIDVQRQILEVLEDEHAKEFPHICQVINTQVNHDKKSWNEWFASSKCKLIANLDNKCFEIQGRNVCFYGYALDIIGCEDTYQFLCRVPITKEMYVNLCQDLQFEIK